MVFDHEDQRQCFLGRPFHCDGTEINITDLLPGADPRKLGEISVSVLNAGELRDVNFAEYEILMLRSRCFVGVEEFVSENVSVFDAACDAFSETLKIVHFPRTIDCIDEKRSHFEKAHERRGNRKYRSVNKIVLNLRKIPEGVHIFRLTDWVAPTFCSESLKVALEAFGANGVRFESIETSFQP